jgi:hypothetical protein
MDIRWNQIRNLGQIPHEIFDAKKMFPLWKLFAVARGQVPNPD